MLLLKGEKERKDSPFAGPQESNYLGPRESNIFGAQVSNYFGIERFGGFYAYSTCLRGITELCHSF